MCVEHLKRCKTSTFVKVSLYIFIFFIIFFISFTHSHPRRRFHSLLVGLLGSGSSFQSRGMERTYEAPSNEAPHMILGYHQGRLVTYLQHHFNFS